MKSTLQHILLWAAGLVFAGCMFGGCQRDASTQPAGNDPSVTMSAMFSKEVTAGAAKSSTVNGVDSIRIDSAVIVFARIKFESHIDTVTIDTIEGDHDGDRDDDHDANISFKGPFVVHVRDTVAIDFATRVLPAGTYDGVKFKIHRLMKYEHCEDSDDRHHRPRMDYGPLMGSSITVWGAELKNGVWTDFTFRFNGEVEFKIKGNFVIPNSTSTVDLVLNFNMGAWFVDPMTGALLDPSDTTFENRVLIRRAIYIALGKGRCGNGHGDGHWFGWR